MADEPQIQALTAALAGRYEIIRELGRGGMAAVYLAKDVKHDREVAVKVLLPELSTTIGADRFEREIKLAAKLQHPHILGLFDSGVAEGQLYYVMPFVKGESLRDRMDREGMLPIEDAMQIALEVNDALGHAHAEGIVHRDIKPENILLSGGHALVADFGIARAVAEGGGKLTQTGMSMGTPQYMSPEQFSGVPVGPPTDLYALACVLYEMLAGEPPFSGKTALQLMAKHSMEQVPSIRVVRNVVSEEIENAIFVTMNKNPADRPQNAEQFAQLLGIQSGNTASMRVFTNTMSRRVPSGAQALLRTMDEADFRPLWRRRPALVAAAVLVVGAVAGWFAFGRKPSAVIAGPEARRLAVLYFADQSRDSSLSPLADGLTEGLIRTLSTASSFSVISPTGAGRFRGSTLGVDSIARALGVGYLVRGDVEREGERVRVSVRLDDASGVNLQRASLTVPSANVLSARDTIVLVAGDLIRRQLGEQFQISELRASTSSAEAWLLVQRGEAARKAMEATPLTDTITIDRQYRAADSLYAAAQVGDPTWAEPEARRALIAYRRSRMTRDQAAMRKWVATGLAHAAAALKLDADNADALELKGTLLYFSWLSNFEEDARKKAVLIDSAKVYLEKATGINPKQASAYSSLSHLYNNHPTTSNTDVLIAAQRAYETDEFLSDAELVLSRLVLAAYDLGQAEKADQWCSVARTRFPKSWRSARCQLFVATMRLKPPDVAEAWRLADTVAALAPNFRLNSAMLVAAVIARASKTNPALADSARRVIRRSEGDATVDPTRDLNLYGAIGYTILGDKADAIRLLKTYLAVNPHKIAGFRDDPGWQYRDLIAEPAYRQMVGAR